MRLWSYIDYIQARIKDMYFQHFQWNCHQLNAIRSHWWLINIGSGKGLVPSGSKPLPEPMLTGISVVIWRHEATRSYVVDLVIRERNMQLYQVIIYNEYNGCDYLSMLVKGSAWPCQTVFTCRDLVHSLWYIDVIWDPTFGALKWHHAVPMWHFQVTDILKLL